MIRRIETDYGIIEYELEIKKVKNINLRVRPDMTVHVSANRRTSTRTIDDFVRSKAEMITTAIAVVIISAFERTKSSIVLVEVRLFAETCTVISGRTRKLMFFTFLISSSYSMMP